MHPDAPAPAGTDRSERTGPVARAPETGTPAAALLRKAGLGPAPRAPQADDPIELQLAVGALKALAVAAVPVLAVAWLAAGPGGLLGAAVATGVVALMYAMSGAMLSVAARLGPGALMGAALGGFALRLMLYALMIVLLRPVEAIHGPSLAIAAAVLLVLTLVWEARMVLRLPNLYWVDAAAARPRPLPATDLPASVLPPTSEPTRNPT